MNAQVIHWVVSHPDQKPWRPMSRHIGALGGRPQPRVGARWWTWMFRAAMAAGMFLAVSVGDVRAQQFEVPSNRSAASVLPPDLLAGPYHRVRERIVSYGFLHHFTVDSSFGVFEVVGDGALRKLVREFSAIAALKEIEQSEAFIRSVGQAAKAPLGFAKSLITNPVDTLSGLPSGVFQIFGNVSEGITMEHDPSEDSAFKQALFVSSWKRDYAAQMGVDVYSSNKVLQEELNRIGWAAAIGGLTVSAVTMGADATAVIVVKQMRLANSVGNVLKEEPPSRLRIINMKKLNAMGVSKALAARFLDHQIFTPRHDTIIVANLEGLQGARGRDAFIRAILSAKDVVGANFFMNIAQTMKGYHDIVSPISDITIVGGFVVARAQNGTALIPFPMDHGVWSQRANNFVSGLIQNYRPAGFDGQFEMWVTGTVSPLARQQLPQLGVVVAEDVDQRILILD